MSVSLAGCVRTPIAAWVLTCCTMAPAGFAFAGEPVKPPDVVRAKTGEADQLFEQGVTARKTGKLVEAESLFQKAWAMKKTWDIAANLGLVQFNLGKIAEGAEHVTYALANFPPTESDAARESLTTALAAARPEVGEIAARCNVQGAEVRIGGEPKGTTPLQRAVFVMPGAVTVEMSKDGYDSVRRTVEVKKGGTYEVAITMMPKAVESERSLLPPAIAFSVGGAGLLMGAIAGGVTAAQTDDLKRVCGDALACSPSERDSLNNTTVAAHVSTAGFVLAAAGVAAGVTLLLVPIRQKPKAPVSIAVGPTFAYVKGSF